tara:strand:+ start:860 stop:1114 length:255 start_codon:yes stop_codon:yes gene_type:complete
MELKKISEELLKQLQEKQSIKARVLHDLGVLESEKHELLHYLAGIEKENKEVEDKVQSEYGKITLNVNDGTYEEIKEKEDVKAN